MEMIKEHKFQKNKCMQVDNTARGETISKLKTCVKADVSDARNFKQDH